MSSVNYVYCIETSQSYHLIFTRASCTSIIPGQFVVKIIEGMFSFFFRPKGFENQAKALKLLESLNLNISYELVNIQYIYKDR